MHIDPKAQDMCTITFPFGACEHLHVQMGLASIVDIFQEKMNCMMFDLCWVQCHLDDTSCIAAGTFQDHSEKLEPVLSRLERSGF